MPHPPIPLLNRELSWLDFNARVLHEALDRRNALLERLKFAAIFCSNLDEFYMVRVGALRRRAALGIHGAEDNDRSPRELLAEIDRRVRELVAQHRHCLDDELLPRLAERGVCLLRMDELSPSEWQHVDAFFEAEVYPVLTPLVVDPAHPFPYISSLSISFALQIRDPVNGSVHFARVKVPPSLPRWVPVGRPNHFVPLEAIVGSNLGALFVGMEVTGCHAFRLTRYSDLELDVRGAADAENLLSAVQQQLFERRFGEVVRLEVQDGMPAEMRDRIIDELRTEDGMPQLTAQDVFPVHGLLDPGGLLPLASLDIPELRDPPFVAAVPVELRDAGRSVFEVMREKDLLVHHPFESFTTTVERFLEYAARDEHVLAIKLALYRTSGDTAIVRALVEAAQRGKQVAVIVELKARFDEENNIQWARTLEDYGVHLSYGVTHLKTHAKIALVVRRDPDGIRRYVHIGSGNYNSRTARLYTDIGLFTTNPVIGSDISDLFNSLTGYARRPTYRKLIVAPDWLRDRLIALIDREAAHAAAGRAARIVAKMNALVDPAVIDALYRASNAGVSIDLIVRGICCLHPGLPGTSQNIRVVSIVGRFLEHSRIWGFSNGGSEEFYIGSADWMPRNLDHRVEVMVPVESPELHARIRALFQVYLEDNRNAWELGSEGTYRQRTPGGERMDASQERLLADPTLANGPVVATLHDLVRGPVDPQLAMLLTLAGSAASSS